MDGQTALNNSVKVEGQTKRRIGISLGEIVILDETCEGLYHRHIRSWQELQTEKKSNVFESIN